MPDYRIIGADLKKYGPASAEQIRQWITEGRVDSDTKLQLEGEVEWKRLADVPEFSTAVPESAPALCPNCGEPFQEGFDSCWKCGTRSDGSPPAKNFTPVEDEPDDEAELRGNPCPACGSPNVRRGKLAAGGESTSVVFQPEGRRFFTWSLSGGVNLTSDNGSACLDCGLVWSHLQPAKLKEFIFRHCHTSGNKEACRILSTAARLEAQGRTAAALAEYAAVKRKFPGTKAARDAEASIRNLKRNLD